MRDVDKMQCWTSQEQRQVLLGKCQVEVGVEPGGPGGGERGQNSRIELREGKKGRVGTVYTPSWESRDIQHVVCCGDRQHPTLSGGEEPCKGFIAIHICEGSRGQIVETFEYQLRFHSKRTFTE